MAMWMKIYAPECGGSSRTRVAALRAHQHDRGIEPMQLFTDWPLIEVPDVHEALLVLALSSFHTLSLERLQALSSILINSPNRQSHSR